MPEPITAAATATLGDSLTGLGLALLTALNAWPHVRKRLGIGGPSDEPGVSRYDDTGIRKEIAAIRDAAIEQGKTLAVLSADANRTRDTLAAHIDSDDAEFRRLTDTIHAVDKEGAKLGAVVDADRHARPDHHGTGGRAP